MTRILLIILAFMTITLGLLLMQPSPRGAGLGEGRFSQTAPAPSSITNGQVTRGQADLVQLASPPVTQPAVAQIVARPIIAAKAPITQAPEADDLRAMTSDILIGLGIKQAPAEATVQLTSLESANGDAQRALTNSVLSGLRAAIAQPEPAESIQSIVVQALREGQSDTYIDALLNAATAEGRIRVPAALVTNTGKVDTSVILASLIEQATGTPSQPTVAVGGPGVEVRVVQKIDGTVQYQFYTVQPGDSLGAIAVKFYGDMRQYTTIYEANRQVIFSPDSIRAGQRLSIPAL